MNTADTAARAEHRWPAAIALIVALTLYVTLPSTFFPVLRYVVVGIGIVLLIPLFAVNPVRLHWQTGWSRTWPLSATTCLATSDVTAAIFSRG